ncbi:MAG: MCE family protein [Planctomycetes bacterium]|nr:MCE family protein [Planctomycetota bacterium]MCB9936395.1 MCE family protein [Planctomycetota bacterium]
MARSKSRSDLITGAFALLVIAAVVAIVMWLQVIPTGVEGARYSILFEDVGGLGGNAPVIVAGQKVGKVDYINTVQIVSADNVRRVEVEVGIIIQEDYMDTVVVPVDSLGVVQMGGLFGGNQLVLKLGNSKELVRPGQRLPLKGRPPVEINDIVETAQDTIKELQEGIQKVAALLSDDRFTENLDKSLSAMRSALERLDKGLAEMEPAFTKVGPTFDSAQSLIEELRTLVKQNSDSINATLSNLERASGKLDTLLADDGDGVPKLVGNLNSIADNLDALVNNINDLVLDNQLNIQISLENVRETTDSLRIFARRIEADPSLLIWGGKEEATPGLDQQRPVPNVDELEIRNSGRRPRKESD